MAEYKSGVITDGLNGRQALVITEDVLNAEFCNILQQAKPPNALTSLIAEARSVMRENSSSLLNVRCAAMRMRDCALLDHALYYCAQQRTVSNVVLRITSETVVRPVIGMVNAGVWPMSQACVVLPFHSGPTSILICCDRHVNVPKLPRSVQEQNHVQDVR